jgi:acyl-CoA thioester hydrolase
MTELAKAPEGARHLLITSRMPVRWGDMDAYGHVNNTVYFRYMEQVVRPDNAVAPVIINAACTFLMPVNYPATVIIRMYGGEPGRSSVMTWYELSIEGDERLYAEGSAKVVWMNPQTGKSVPLPEVVRAAVC